MRERRAHEANLVRALCDGGSQICITRYGISGSDDSRLIEQSQKIVDSMGDSLTFRKGERGTRAHEVHCGVDFFASHEGLLMPYGAGADA